MTQPPSSTGTWSEQMSGHSDIDGLLDIVSQLVDRVFALEQRGTPQDAAKSGTPFQWDVLEPDELHEKWLELGGWVSWLCARFRIDDLPPCWYRHDDLVEELTALWLAWLGAYQADARSDDPVRWLDWLARARARFARRSPRCGVGAHKEHPLSPVHDEHDFSAFVAMTRIRQSGN